MRQRERRDDEHERAEAPERDDQADEKEQVVRPVEDVAEAEFDEPQGRLMPAGIEADQAHVPRILEGAHGAARRQEAHHGQRPLAQTREPRVDRELGPIGLDGVLDQHVDQPLAPEQLRVGREGITRDVGERRVERGERLVGGLRGTNGGDARAAERGVAFVQVDVVDQPDGGGVVQDCVGAAHIEPVGAAHGVFDIAHGLEGRADQHLDAPTIRLQQHLDGDVVRDVVGPQGRGRRQGAGHDGQGQNPVFRHARYCILRRMMRTRNVLNVFIGAAFLAGIVALGVGQNLLEQRAVAQAKASASAPRFEVDPFWPRPLPNHWILGSTIGVSVDSQDHVWIIHRGAATLDPKELWGTGNPPASDCCAAAPPVLEFDQAGNLLNHWGGPGQGFEWPERTTASPWTARASSGLAATARRTATS